MVLWIADFKKNLQWFSLKRSLKTAAADTVCNMGTDSSSDIIRDKFPEQIPSYEEQQLLRDRLFHGSRKSIRDSVEYCYADTIIEYLIFLEEYSKAEEKSKSCKH